MAKLAGAFVAGVAAASLLPAKQRERVSFVMKLNHADNLAEYKRRHDGADPHWDGPKAQLHSALTKNGVHNYSIFHSPETNVLYAYAELDDSAGFERTSKTADCAIWWKYFEDAKLMRYNDDAPNTLLGGATPWADGLNEVFHMD